MTAVVILRRKIGQLHTASELGFNLAKFNAVTVPCALPVGVHSDSEALNLYQLKEVIVANMNLTGIVPNP